MKSYYVVTHSTKCQPGLHKTHIVLAETEQDAIDVALCQEGVESEIATLETALVETILEA